MRFEIVRLEGLFVTVSIGLTAAAGGFTNALLWPSELRWHVIVFTSITVFAVTVFCSNLSTI